MIHKTMLVCNLFDKAIIANGKTSAIIGTSIAMSSTMDR